MIQVTDLRLTLLASPPPASLSKISTCLDLISKLERSRPLLHSSVATGSFISGIKLQMMKMSWFSRFSKYVKSVMASNSTAGYEKLKTHDDDSDYMKVKKFTYHELASATENFKNLIGEGDLGRVYKGVLKSGQVVAVKKLKHWTLDISMEILSMKHSSFTNLIGCSQDEDQRLLVYEHMPLGSLKNYLSDLNQKPIDWETRIKIAIGVARGLEYLHCKKNPPVFHRNLKTSDILLDYDFNPKLSDIGMEFKPVVGWAHVYKGGYYYNPPEYRGLCGRWTLKSDIYCFGVVLLELITGHKSDRIKSIDWWDGLDDWPFLKARKEIIELVDPLLEGRFPVHSMQRVVKLAAMCVDRHAMFRPSIDYILVELEYSASPL